MSRLASISVFVELDPPGKEMPKKVTDTRIESIKSSSKPKIAADRPTDNILEGPAPRITQTIYKGPHLLLDLVENYTPRALESRIWRNGDTCSATIYVVEAKGELVKPYKPFGSELIGTDEGRIIYMDVLMNLHDRLNKL